MVGIVSLVEESALVLTEYRRRRRQYHPRSPDLFGYNEFRSELEDCRNTICLFVVPIMRRCWSSVRLISLCGSAAHLLRPDLG